MKVFNTSNTWRGFTKNTLSFCFNLIPVVSSDDYNRDAIWQTLPSVLDFLTRADHNHNPPKEDLIVTASSPAGGCITATCTSPWHPSDQDVGNNIYWYLDSHVDDGKMHLVVDDS